MITISVLLSLVKWSLHFQETNKNVLYCLPVMVLNVFHQQKIMVVILFFFTLILCFNPSGIILSNIFFILLKVYNYNCPPLFICPDKTNMVDRNCTIIKCFIPYNRLCIETARDGNSLTQLNNLNTRQRKNTPYTCWGWKCSFFFFFLLINEALSILGLDVLSLNRELEKQYGFWKGNTLKKKRFQVGV